MRMFLFVLAALASWAAESAATPKQFENVLVTGYYGVLLSDYDPKATEEVVIDGQSRIYNASFLAVVRIKTKGGTLAGENLIFWEQEWSLKAGPPDDAYPKEEDFVTMQTVRTKEDGKKHTFPKAFIDEVALQGSGKIAEGQYLGRPWDEHWHIRHKALDASGREVEIGVVAVDPQFFNAKKPLLVTIEPLPPGLNVTEFHARDLGPDIVEFRIDVFTGWGFKEGLARAWNLTGDNYTVTFGS